MYRGKTGTSRALQAVRSVRERLQAEQRRNFQPYPRVVGRKRAAETPSTSAKKKGRCWSPRFVCLADKNQKQVPSSVVAKEVLVQAGLGEKKVHGGSGRPDSSSLPQ